MQKKSSFGEETLQECVEDVSVSIKSDGQKSFSELVERQLSQASIKDIKNVEKLILSGQLQKKRSMQPLMKELDNLNVSSENLKEQSEQFEGISK